MECRKCEYRPQNVDLTYLSGVHRVNRVDRVVFSMFGGLGGDFCKDIYEAKLFGMHIGSVLSGFDAGNLNTGAQMLIIGYVDVYD